MASKYDVINMEWPQSGQWPKKVATGHYPTTNAFMKMTIFLRNEVKHIKKSIGATCLFLRCVSLNRIIGVPIKCY